MERMGSDCQSPVARRKTHPRKAGARRGPTLLPPPPCSSANPLGSGPGRSCSRRPTCGRRSPARSPEACRAVSSSKSEALGGEKSRAPNRLRAEDFQPESKEEASLTFSFFKLCVISQLGEKGGGELKERRITQPTPCTREQISFDLAGSATLARTFSFQSAL